MSTISLFGNNSGINASNILGTKLDTNSSNNNNNSLTKRPGGPWLNAWTDPLSSLNSLSCCMRLADIQSDGEYRLLIADADKKLKVYKGTALASEHALLDIPSSLAIFYSDLNKPQTPSIAVAAGSYIFIYRNLRPYYKFTLPPIEIEQLELDLWANLRTNKIELDSAIQQLAEAREKGIQLSARSTNLLSLQETKEQLQYIETQRHLPLIQLTVATCMETLNKNQTTERAISSLVIGTESKHVIIMDPSGTNILKKISVPSVPVLLSVTGLYDVEYRIVVACRNGNLYQIKKGKLVATVIELESQPCGLVTIEKNILVGCMDNCIHSFHFKGKKNYSLYLPDTITNMELLQLKRIKNVTCLIVALANGELRLYNKKHCIHTLQLAESVTAIRFGPYGREEASLCLTTKSGALHIKMLQRAANLDVSSSPAGAPVEQDIPLNVPKKTKLYVEQTQRERDQAVQMHRLFQRDLCKLRLNTARSYVKIISEGAGPLSSIGGISLRLDAKIQGLGPYFKLKLGLKNTGNKPVYDSPITINYNHSLYYIEKGFISVPVLIPGLDYEFEIEVKSIDNNGAAEPIKVFVCSNKSAIPTISAIVNMPVAEILE